MRFEVLGRPQPAGSKRAFAIRRKGVITGIAVTDDAKGSRPWKDSVIVAARDALNGAKPLTGPLQLDVAFYVSRPAGHYGTGRNRHLVKASSPRYPAVRPDATKLLRAVEDAMTEAGVWRDDAQVVAQTVVKYYGSPDRAEIEVLPVDWGTT